MRTWVLGGMISGRRLPACSCEGGEAEDGNLKTLRRPRPPHPPTPTPRTAPRSVDRVIYGDSRVGECDQGLLTPVPCQVEGELAQDVADCMGQAVGGGGGGGGEWASEGGGVACVGVRDMGCHGVPWGAMGVHVRVGLGVGLNLILIPWGEKSSNEEGRQEGGAAGVPAVVGQALPALPRAPGFCNAAIVCRAGPQTGSPNSVPMHSPQTGSPPEPPYRVPNQGPHLSARRCVSDPPKPSALARHTPPGLPGSSAPCSPAAQLTNGI
jgi:hypothetical protein